MQFALMIYHTPEFACRALGEVERDNALKTSNGRCFQEFYFGELNKTE